MSRLKRIAQSLHSPDNITQAPKIPWTPIGPGEPHLLNQLDEMYWEGLKSELENIIRTLRIWQQPEFDDVKIEDESDDHVHGFDTFLDQVSQVSRDYAIRYGEFVVSRPSSSLWIVLIGYLCT